MVVVGVAVVVVVVWLGAHIGHRLWFGLQRRPGALSTTDIGG